MNELDMLIVEPIPMDKIIWHCNRYAIIQHSTDLYELIINGIGYQIFKECDVFTSNSLCFCHIPKYVKKALNKYIGEIIY